MKDGYNEGERASMIGMFARLVELYGVQRYWEGVSGTAQELPEDIIQTAKSNAAKAVFDQIATIEACNAPGA